MSLLLKIGDDYIVIINSVPFESAMLNLDIGRQEGDAQYTVGCELT